MRPAPVLGGNSLSQFRYLQIIARAPCDFMCAYDALMCLYRQAI
ncbi:hypothetical protein VP137E351_P0045 [Vibrio phage 137E35-1]|nr:hypothetical protein VP137E351_P0045 [Vibrio phage 137E35-1]CAH9016296.1 hypothetical protein VP230E391_P0045 [Vibrio phage 230E39-1]